MFIAVCLDRLGLEDGRIKDSKITASTEWSSNHAATFARLNRPPQSGGFGGWTPKVTETDPLPWIQVDLGVLMLVSGVVMQGREDEWNRWVPEYQVESSDDGMNWEYVRDANQQLDTVRLLLYVYRG